VKLSFLQLCPVRGDPARNISVISGALDGADADFVVLPELATTGYMFADRDQAMQMAETVDGPTVTGLARICATGDLHVVCGFAERDGDRLFNSAVLVGPQGHVATYRKTHLFRDEKTIFDPGDSGFFVSDVRGVKVGMLVCFDWIFPEAARTLALMGAEVIAHPSNLVLPWAQAATVTRCIENRVYWVLANRTGTETEGETTLAFTGCSRVVAPAGRVMLDAGKVDDTLGIVEVDPALARDKSVNPENDLLADRRPGFYR
jgi:predicted amidohydrolase